MRKHNLQRVAYFLVDTVKSKNYLFDDEKKALCDTICEGFKTRDLEAAAHVVAGYLSDDEKDDFINKFYKMYVKESELSPEAQAALITAAASIGVAMIGYVTKTQVLQQCRSNMMFESGGGVWSTTSSQKIASMLHDMLK